MLIHGFHKSYFSANEKNIHSHLWERHQKRKPHLTDMIQITVSRDATTIKASHFAVWIHNDFYYERKHLQECIEDYNTLAPKAKRLTARLEKFLLYSAQQNIKYFNSLSPKEAEDAVAKCRSSGLEWHETLPLGITKKMVVQKTGKSLIADYGWSNGVNRWETFNLDGSSKKGRMVAKRI